MNLAFPLTNFRFFLFFHPSISFFWSKIFVFSLSLTISCNEAWGAFLREYKSAVDKKIPVKKMKANKKTVWMKAGVVKSVKKHQLYMKYRRTQKYKDYQEYAKQRNRAKKAVVRAQAAWEKKLCLNLRWNQSNFFCSSDTSDEIINKGLREWTYWIVCK